jgi:hypothetical protein
MEDGICTYAICEGNFGAHDPVYSTMSRSKEGSEENKDQSSQKVMGKCFLFLNLPKISEM